MVVFITYSSQLLKKKKKLELLLYTHNSWNSIMYVNRCTQLINYFMKKKIVNLHRRVPVKTDRNCKRFLTKIGGGLFLSEIQTTAVK